MIKVKISLTMYNNRPAERAVELENVKRNIYREYLDDLTIRKMRHEMQNKPWTMLDEEEYEKAYKLCTEKIAVEEAKPLFYPYEDNEVKVLSDEEYEKEVIAEEEKRKAKEEAARKAEEERLKAEQEVIETELGVDNILQGEEKNVRSHEDDKQVF